MESAIKRHGGKSYLARRIVEAMPERARNSNNPSPSDPGWLHYVEPYFGAGSVLFALDPEGISEVVNDLDSQLSTFWSVLQSEELFPQFERIVQAVPFSQWEYDRACKILSRRASEIATAVAFFVRNRQSRQALEKCFATMIRNRTRRGMNEHSSAWLSAVDGLPEVHARLRGVAILNDDAVRVIRQEDGPRTLFYLDPPYVHATRTVRDAYQRFEMSDSDHAELLSTLAQVQGRFLLSGYRCALYDAEASRRGWRRVDFEIDNKSGAGKSKQRRVESLWMNY